MRYEGQSVAGSIVDRRVREFHRLAGGSAEFALLLTGQAGEQLQGLGCVLDAGAYVWAPRPLIRSIFEWCADAYWLSDERLDGSAAAARWLLYDAVSVGEQRRLAELARAESGFMADWPNRDREVKDAIERAGLPPIDQSSNRRQHWTLAGQRLGTTTDRIEAFLDHFFPGASEKIPWYPWWSHMTHPSATAARTLSRTRPEDHGATISFPSEPIPLIIGWSRGALAAWAMTARHVTLLFGWQHEELSSWLDHVDDHLDAVHGVSRPSTEESWEDETG